MEFPSERMMLGITRPKELYLAVQVYLVYCLVSVLGSIEH